MTGTNGTTFSVDLSPDGSTVTSYDWEFKTPSGAARVPSSFFDDNTSATPSVPKPQWFATNGKTMLHEENPGQAEYEIRCKVETDCGNFESDWVKWNVYAIKGEPKVKHAELKGSPTLKASQTPDDERLPSPNYNNRYKAEVDAIGSLNRVAAYISSYGGMSQTNTFYPKIIDVHEGEHLAQWSSQSPWADLFDAQYAFDQVKDMVEFGSDASDAKRRLKQAVDSKIEKIIDDFEACATHTSNDRERLAHEKSNGTPPNYLNRDLSRYPQSSGAVNCSF